MALTTIAALATNPMAMFEMSVACEVFGLDRTDDGVPPFSFITCGEQAGQPVATTSGGHFVPSHGWADAVAAAPARALGVKPPRLAAGEPADMILTQARDFTELFSRPQADRVVIRNGASLDEMAPHYAQLDALEGLAP